MIKIENILFSDTKIIIYTKKGNGFFDISNSERLKYADKSQIEDYTITPFGLHWDKLDEDLCFDGFNFDFDKNDNIRYIFPFEKK